MTALLRKRRQEKRAEYLETHIPLDVIAEAIYYSTDGVRKLARRVGVEPQKAGIPDPAHPKMYVTNEEALRIVDESTGLPNV